MTDQGPSNSNTFMMPLDDFTDDEFRKLLDEWCTPMDLEQLRSPILMDNPNTAFAFDMTIPGSSNLHESSTLIGSYTLNSTVNATGPRDPSFSVETSPIQSLQVPDTSDLKEIDDLKERVRYLEQKVRAFDHYIQQLIPWTIGIAKEFEKLATLISSKRK